MEVLGIGRRNCQRVAHKTVVQAEVVLVDSSVIAHRVTLLAY